MAKTEITAYDMLNLFKDIYEGIEYNIVVINENTQEKKNVEIQNYLKTDFYTYTKDLRGEPNEFYGYDGFNFPNLDQWLHSRGFTQSSYAQVELVGLEVVASEDIDMGSANAKITFVMPIDKADILESHLGKIRSEIAGRKYYFYNASGEKVDFYASLGETTYEEAPENTPLGKCVFISVTFGIAFMQQTLASNDSEVEISLDGTNWESLIYTNDDENIAFTGKENLISNKPYAIGTVISSVTYVRTITYWIFTKDSFQLALNRKIKSITNDTTSYTDSINIPIWLREKVPYYNNDGVLSYETMTTQMVVTNYKIVKKNSDFVNVSLSLSRYGK